jgi:hypothetical protein
MITMSYSRASAPSARAIAEASDGQIVLVDGSRARVNWGRAGTNIDRTPRLNDDTSGTTNKRVMRERFAEHNVPAPQLYTPDEALYAIEHGEVYGGALVGRPDFHTRGKAFWLCRNRADVERAIRGTRRKAAATHFMRFVPLEHEFRVHVFMGKSIRISEKEYITEPDCPMWKRDYRDPQAARRLPAQASPPGREGGGGSGRARLRGGRHPRRRRAGVRAGSQLGARARRLDAAPVRPSHHQPLRAGGLIVTREMVIEFATDTELQEWLEFNQQNRRHLAQLSPMTREQVDFMLTRPVDAELGDMDGRSEWLWVRFPNGDLMCGFFPHGDSYFEHEVERGI